MLSVVIPTRDCDRVLVRTLAALVDGSVRGLVRDVVIADGGSSDETLEVAEIAGCDPLVSNAPLAARLREAAAAARGGWLLFLRPGSVLEPGWVDAAARFIEQTDGLSAEASGAVFRNARVPGQPFFAELAALVKSALAERAHPQQGLIISRAAYDRLGGHRDGVADPEADLLRRLGRRRLIVLSSAVTQLEHA